MQSSKQEDSHFSHEVNRTTSESDSYSTSDCNNDAINYGFDSTDVNNVNEQMKTASGDCNELQVSSLEKCSSKDEVPESKSPDTNKTPYVEKSSQVEASYNNISNHCIIVNQDDLNRNLARVEKKVSLPVEEEKISKNKTYLKKIINVEAMDPETVCGLGIFRPQWLQRWATPRTYLVLYAILGLLQGSYYSYLIGVLSTLEKRYAFKSKISGAILMIDEIIPLFIGIGMGYFGGKAHRPRLVAIGMIASSLCCFISALPYFLYGTSQVLVSSSVNTNSTVEHCDGNLKMEYCDSDQRQTTGVAVACLFFGNFLKGFGSLAYYTLGLSYMDDTAKKKNTPIYLAITLSLRLFGPTAGFLLSSAFLQYYENPRVDPGFGIEDPRWVGGWWIGFVIQGVLLMVFGLPMALFPRRLPRQRERTLSNTKNFNQEDFTQRLKGLFGALKRLWKNPFFCFLALSTIFSINGGFGYYIMLPKYMESQFRLTASDANLYSVPPALTSVQIFTVVGGLAVWKWKPSVRQLIGGTAITEVIGILGYLVLMIPNCGNIHLKGAVSTGGSLELQSECNADCFCTTGVYTPVCGADGVTTYFSPCHAGCTEVNETSDSKSYMNCLCDFNETLSFNTVTNGVCTDATCWSKALIFICILPVLSAFNAIFKVAHTMILLRSILPQDKSVAIGTFEAVLCLCAFIPFPLVYNAMADSACQVWEKSCGKTGNCWIYDVDALRYMLHLVSVAFAICSLFCTIGMYFQSHHVRNLYVDEEDEFSSNRVTHQQIDRKTKPTK